MLKAEYEITKSTEVKNLVTIDLQRTGSYHSLSGHRKNRILIIEDNRSLAEVVAMIFEDDGRVEIAENGNEGLTKLSNTYFDAVISDIEMPIMNGIEFFYQALKICPSIRDKIVFCSGSSKEDHHRFINKFCLKYLPKPYNLDDIRNIVTGIIRETSVLS
ncbi:MAG: response regulator [Nitrospiraceae bacterium]|nr:MAG: response regulator [Nitrospiraceae bacterium]